MATPNYKGQGQPTSDSGGWFGSLLGGGAPAYAGKGQPSSKSGYLAGSAPAYKPAPPPAPAPAPAPAAVTTSATDLDMNEPTSFAIVIPRQMIEQ